MWAFRAFPEPEFYFCFQFFRSVDLNKVTKRCVNALTLNLSYVLAWSLMIYWGHFGRIMRNDVCREVGTHTIDTVSLRFLYLSRGDFFEIDVFYSTFEHIFKKSFVFASLSNFSVSLLYFSPFFRIPVKN